MMVLVSMSFLFGFMSGVALYFFLKNKPRSLMPVSREQLAIAPSFKKENEVLTKLDEAKRLAVKVDDLLKSISLPDRKSVV